MAGSGVSIYCPHCHRHTGLNYAPAAYDTGYNKKYTPAVWSKSESESWWIGICNYCTEPVLCLNGGRTIYPSELPQPTDDRVPEPMKTDFDEAKSCYHQHLYRACSVMARRCMQSACLDKGVASGNLVGQIEQLRERGLITEEIKEWADVVRWVGNDAAHPESPPVEEEDAKDILELTEQFLRVLYVAPSIARERRERRGR